MPDIWRSPLLISMAVALFALSACVRTIEIVSGDLSFSSDEISLQAPGSKVSAQGYIIGQLEADFDMIAYALKNDLNAWVKPYNCKTGQNFSGSDIYKLTNSNNDRTAYRFLIHPRSHSLFNRRTRTLPEEVCVRIGAGSMNPFGNVRSEEYRIPIDQATRSEVISYLAEEKPVEFRLDPACADHNCRPDYTK